ncbi:protein-export chaperone SecB [Gilvimarinus sp. F26214L]|uniref:protein-export chaperone SecB n=1 Tax=Gilvimarinus sp. DZF01 TaxID=3461371 RepID=UPI0040466C05
MADENQQSTDATENNAQAGNGQQFAVQRIYVKDVSFEAPLGVNAFGQAWKPQVNQEINSKNQRVAENQYEVVLSLTITVKLDDKVAFLVEIQHAGLFGIAGLEDRQLTQVLNTMCLQILFPYARETVDSLVTKGSFPALMLPPINFDALFAQAVARSQENAESGEGEGSDQSVN